MRSNLVQKSPDPVKNGVKSAIFLSSSRFTSVGAHEATVSNKRLGQGENLFSVAFYQKYQSIQIIKHPISIVFLASSNANTGDDFLEL